MSEVFLVSMKTISNNIKDLHNFEMFNKPEHVAMATIRLPSRKITEWLWSVNAVTKEMCQSLQGTPPYDSVLLTGKPFRTLQVLHMNIPRESTVHGAVRW